MPVGEVDGGEAGGDGAFDALLEEAARLGEQGRDRLGGDAVVVHEAGAGGALVEAEAQVALALIEADELGDVGGGDADATASIEPDGELILRCDGRIGGDHRLGHAAVLQ